MTNMGPSSSSARRIRAPRLVRRVTTNLLATVAPEPAEQVLCRNARSLSIEFYDWLEWLDTWDSSTLAGELPLAVRITVGIAVPDDAEAGTVTVTRTWLVPARPTEGRSRPSEGEP